MKHSHSYIAIPPGETIREQLEYLGMSQTEFAVRMGMNKQQISDLLTGDLDLDPEIAEKLEIVLGPPAAFWSNLEANYRMKLAKVNEENTHR